MLADLDALDAFCEAEANCTETTELQCGEVLFSAGPLTKCGALARCAFAEQVAGRIVGVMAPKAGGSTGRIGIPASCFNNFGHPATLARAVEVAGGLALLLLNEELADEMPAYLVLSAFGRRRLGHIEQQPRISIPVATVFHRDLIPILDAAADTSIILQMQTGAITPAAMEQVKELYDSLISMTFYNPTLDNADGPPLTPNSHVLRPNLAAP